LDFSKEDIMKRKTGLQKIVLISALLVLLMLSATWVSASVPPVPTYASADVNCNDSEWNTTILDPFPTDPLLRDQYDFFADLCRAWDCTNKPVEARVFLRYQCIYPLPDPPAVPDVIVYALVLAEPNVPILVSGLGADPSMAHIKVLDISNGVIVDGNDDNNCTPTNVPPEFSWINKQDTTIGGSPVTVADGWEASFQIPADVYQELLVHTQVYDGGASQTAGVNNQGIPLTVDSCPPTPSAVTLASFAAAPAGKAIQVTWDTASEIDTLGFNLYRADAINGTRLQLNSGLIPSQIPGSPMGASYQFADTSALAGVTYYYWLEDVDATGMGSLHGPVSAALQPLRRLMPARPRFGRVTPGLRIR
jgi:hypothetical protein